MAYVVAATARTTVNQSNTVTVQHLGRTTGTDRPNVSVGADTHVIPRSTAECEMCFSLRNVIISDTRRTLLVSNVSSLMFSSSSREAQPTERFYKSVRPRRQVRRYKTLYL